MKLFWHMPLSRQHGDQISLCTYLVPAFFKLMNTAFAKARANLEIDDWLAVDS